MKKCFKRMFHQADIFGQPVNLKLNGEDAVTSSFGGFITFSLIFFILFTFGYYSVNCFFKLNPLVAITIDYLDDNERDSVQNSFLLNTTKLNFMINSYPYDIQVDLTPYLFIDSRYNYTYYLDDKVYNATIFSNKKYCISFENINETLWLSQLLRISYCKNNNEICKNRNDINEFIQQKKLFINYWFDSDTINPHNYTHPISKQTNEFWSKIVKEAFVYVNPLFTPHELYTDDDFLFSNNKKYNNSTFAIIDQNMKEIVYPIDANDGNTLWIVQTELNYQTKIIYKRKYEKISDILAKVGGVSNVLLAVCEIIISLFCKFIRDERIANYLYDFDVTDNENTQIKNGLRNIKIKEYISNTGKINPNNDMNLTHKNLENKESNSRNEFKIINNFSQIEVTNRGGEINRINPNLGSINLELSKIDKKEPDLSNEYIQRASNNEKLKIQLVPFDKIIEKREKKNYRFRFIDLLNYHLCCHFKKNSNLNIKYWEYVRVKTEMNSVLDVRRILYQTQDYDNFKMVLLNNEQYALLNFITKYNLVQKTNDSTNKFISDKNFLKNEENLYKLVNDLLLKLKDNEFKLTLNSTTSKLIEYFDNKFLDTIL